MVILVKVLLKYSGEVIYFNWITKIIRAQKKMHDNARPASAETGRINGGF